MRPEANYSIQGGGTTGSPSFLLFNVAGGPDKDMLDAALPETVTIRKTATGFEIRPVDPMSRRDLDRIFKDLARRVGWEPRNYGS